MREGVGPIVGGRSPVDVLGDRIRAGRLDLPLPGGGATAARLEALADLGETDLSLARLAEGHVDAVAILAESGRPSHPSTFYGVWAATSPAARVVGQRRAGRWRLSGRKQFCSAAETVDRALVTAETEGGTRLFDIDCSDPGVQPVPGTWPAVGMAESRSLDVVFDGIEVEEAGAVGGPGFYTARPGFWPGSIGVAACWYGGGRGLVGALLSYLAEGEPDEHQYAHLGALTARCRVMAQVLDDAARRIDADPANRHGTFLALALEVRHLIVSGCTEILDRVGRAGGARPLSLDGEQSRRAADLYVYLRQHRGERDLAQLGRLAMQGRPWC